MEGINATNIRKASKKAAKKILEEAAAQTKSSRLQFTEEELSAPELEMYIEKSNQTADHLEAAKAEKAAFKANVNFQYYKLLHDNLQIVQLVRAIKLTPQELNVMLKDRDSMHGSSAKEATDYDERQEDLEHEE